MAVTHHDEPRDERRVPDVPEAAVVDVRLHLQVEEEALVDDVGNPAGGTAQEGAKPRNLQTSISAVEYSFMMDLQRQLTNSRAAPAVTQSRGGACVLHYCQSAVKEG